MSFDGHPTRVAFFNSKETPHEEVDGLPKCGDELVHLRIAPGGGDVVR